MTIQIERGNTKKITVTVRDENGDLVDPDSNELNITIKCLGTDATVISSTAMTKESTGIYSYYWETSSDYTVGEYQIEFSATYNSKPFVSREKVEVVEDA